MKIPICIALFAGILTTSCHNTKQTTGESAGSEVLFMYQWNLAGLQQKKVAPSSNQPHLLFYPGQVSRVSGSTGCNKLNGTFELTGTNNIKFSPLATTRMACPGNKVEGPFTKALAEVDTWHIINRELLLSKGETLIIKLKGITVDPSK